MPAFTTARSGSFSSFGAVASPHPGSVPKSGVWFLEDLEREQERRFHPRRPLSCAATLVDHGNESSSLIPAECANIGHGGLYASVPIGHGVAIGKRYTFELQIGETGPEPGSRHTVSQRGEIVRAELMLGEGGYADRVGVGVRFCGPRSGDVPLPSLG